MPIRPGDKKLRPKDRVVLEAYRDHIDPERRGVAFANWSFYSGSRADELPCCVCSGPVYAADGREFYLKPYTQPVDLDRVKGVCGECCRRAWEAHKDESRIVEGEDAMYYPRGERGVRR